MSLFGLAHLASRHALPRANTLLGYYYLACGTACLLSPALAFPHPWPMGIVFSVGEWAGGMIFHQNRRRD